MTNTEGRFSLSVAESEIQDGYLIETSGGELGDASFNGVFKAIYGATESKDKVNATITTTLLSELALLDGNGTLIDRRDRGIALLSSIGLFTAQDWNYQDPTDVDLLSLHADIPNDWFSVLISTLVADLQDEELSVDNMRYFPLAYGGITYFSFTETANIISSSLSSLASDSAKLNRPPIIKSNKKYIFLT
jgi:hypothetical protein